MVDSRKLLVFAALATIIGQPLSNPLVAQTPSAAVMSLDSLLSIPVESASRYVQSAREAPASVTVVTAEEIRRFGYTTLGEVLQFSRGFYTSDDRIVSQVGVRGFSSTSQVNPGVLVLLNGQRRNDPYFDTALTGETFGVDLSVVDRIEIVRGPGSAAYGSNAMFAVINVITKTAADAQETFIQGGVGSFGRKEVSVGHSGSVGAGVQLVANAYWRNMDGQDLYFPEFDAPETNFGIATKRDAEEAGGAFAELRWGDFSISVGGQKRDKGLAAGAFGALFNEQSNEISNDWLSSAMRYETVLSSDVSVAGGVSYDRSHTRGHLLMAGPGGTLDFHSRGQRFTADGQLQWDPIASNRLSVGIEVQSRFHVENTVDVNSGFLVTTLESPFTILSAWAQDEWSVTQDLSLHAGARLDHYSTVGSALTPRAAVVYRLADDGTFKVLYGEAFRAPTPFELFVGQPGLVLSNPDLEPERIRTLELAYERRLTDGLFGAISFYDIRMTNLIDRLFDPLSGLPKFFNQSSAEGRGFEVELKAQPGERFGGTMSAAYQLVSESNDMGLPNSPRFSLRVTGWTLAPAGVTIASTFRHDSSRLTLGGSQTSPATVVDLGLNSPEHWPVQVSLSVRNLLDEQYSTPVGLEFPQQAIRQDGRSVVATLRTWF
ncbi:MAG: TonB-dependent receptor [Gemmatimonadota bacterium]|nr:TonB-dependent receptor [Gemmatimonadota bacterium]